MATSSACGRTDSATESGWPAAPRSEGTIILAPPRTTDTPTADWRPAYEACGPGNPFCDFELTPTIYYARVTLTHMLGDIQPDGSTKMKVVDRLLYVIQYDGDECPSHGPPERSLRSDFAPTYPCTSMAWIDAGTGEALGGAAWGIDLAMPRR